MPSLQRFRRSDRIDVPKWYWDKWQKKIRIDQDISGFSEIAASVINEGRTYLGFERLYTLWQTVIQSPREAHHLEVGVYRGGQQSSSAMPSTGSSPRLAFTRAIHFPAIRKLTGASIHGIRLVTFPASNART